MGRLRCVLLCSECALCSKRLFSLMQAPLHVPVFKFSSRLDLCGVRG